MIIVSHTHYGASVHSSVLDDNTITDWRDAHRYAVGFSKPNYPMPAIVFKRADNPHVHEAIRYLENF